MTQDFSTNPEATRVLRMFSTESGNLYVTGEAGTGKSTLLRELRATALRRRQNLAVVAPTALAATLVEGTTIHRLFGFSPMMLHRDTLREWRPKDKVRDILKNLHALVIDEVSMVRADLFEAMEWALCRYGPYPGRPWGGVRLICFGDFLQLAPVVVNSEKEWFGGALAEEGGWRGAFAFETDAWESAEFTRVTLRHVYRQPDPDYRNMLGRIRIGLTEAEDLTSLAGRVQCCEDKDAVRLCPRNQQADKLNQNRMEELPEPEFVWESKEQWFDREGALVSKPESAREDAMLLPVPLRLRLRVGARVMLRINLNESGRVNGDFGVVTGVSPDAVRVRFDADGAAGAGVEISRAEWKIHDYEFDRKTRTVRAFVRRTFSQIPLTPAWAISIHKAQGQTVRGRMVVAPGCFAAGQFYVALSRVTRLEDLYLENPVQSHEIRVSSTALTFMQ